VPVCRQHAATHVGLLRVKTSFYLPDDLPGQVRAHGISIS
jgi:hypothetical protein